MERAPDDQFEYYDGYVEAMGPATIAHNRVCMNLYKEIGCFLEGKKCESLPILIDSRRRFIQLCRRQGFNLWMFEIIKEPNAELYIEAIDFRIAFDDIYRNTGL